MGARKKGVRSDKVGVREKGVYLRKGGRIGEIDGVNEEEKREKGRERR